MPSLAGLSLSAPTSVRWCRVDRRLEQLSLDGLFHRGDGSTHPRIFDKLEQPYFPGQAFKMEDQAVNQGEGNKMKGNTFKIDLILKELKGHIGAVHPGFCWMDTMALVANPPPVL